jgi:KipI family sensor histidine kinase inhibitor
MGGWSLSHVGDSAVVLEFEQTLDPLVNARAMAVGGAVRRAGQRGVQDVLEGFCSVTVVFKPLETDLTELISTLQREADVQARAIVGGREIALPVCYGGSFGPDLGAVASFGSCSEQEVIRTHSASVYRVYMLGFMPGFSYMATVDSRIAMPRRVEPRVRVPAGSVGIAGMQTGLYPFEAPGGWQLIGRCPIKVFDIENPNPCLLRVGDSVRFRAITEEEYLQLG